MVWDHLTIILARFLMCTFIVLDNIMLSMVPSETFTFLYTAFVLRDFIKYHNLLFEQF